MKRIFTISLLLSFPLVAMLHYPSQQNYLEPKEIDAYVKLLSDAAASGDLDRLQLLQKLDEEEFDRFLNYPNSLGATPLYWASQNGHTAVVKYLLEEKATPSQELMLGASNAQKIPCTPLHIAAAQGHLKIVQLLVGNMNTLKPNNQHAPKELNSQHAPKKRTALHYAIANGHIPTAIYLIIEWAFYLADEDGITPLSLAAQYNDPFLTEALCDGGNRDEFMVHNAACWGWKEDLIEYLALKPNLEKIDLKNQATPLIYAARNGHANIVQLLLNANANVHAKDKEGFTATDRAMQNNHHDVIAVLEKELKKRWNLINASALGQVQDISMFIALKANLEETDFKTGSTPLIWAANCGHAQAVQLLLDAGANINAKSKAGLTALDSSKECNHFEVVAVLEEALKKAPDGDDKGKDEATK